MAKILFITPMWNEEFTPRDAKVCNYFVDNWVNQGHTVIVVHYRSQFPEMYHKIAAILPMLYKKICGDNTGLRNNIPEKVYFADGYTTLSIPFNKYIPHGKISDREYKKQAKRIIQYLSDKCIAPDVIIGHFCCPSLGIIHCLQKQYANAKTAIVLHEKSATLKNIFGNKAEAILNSVDSVGFRSMSIRENICSTYKLKNNLFMCYSGVASSFVKKPVSSRVWSDGTVSNFLYVGRLASYKYPQSIVSALAKLYTNKNFSMTYIGSLDKAYSDTLKMVEKTGTSNQVSFLGKIKRDEILSWYDSSECFVMISDNEVFGLVYLEAMARGCITIAGDNGGMVGIIENGVDGFLCKPGDADALALIIDTINHMTSEEKKIMSDKARATAVKYSDNKVAIDYLSNVL